MTHDHYFGRSAVYKAADAVDPATVARSAAAVSGLLLSFGVGKRGTILPRLFEQTLTGAHKC